MVYRIVRRTGPKRILDPESLRSRRHPPQRPFAKVKTFRVRLPKGTKLPAPDAMTPDQIRALRQRARELNARLVLDNGLVVHPNGGVEFAEGDVLEIGADDPWPTRAEALRMLGKRRRSR
ncbi:MAG: hypothetical protein ACOZDY_11040 [Pseudomonadota bacterium]